MQCLQISGRDRSLTHHERSILWRLACAFESHWKIQRCAGGRQETCESRGFHAGQALEFADDLLLELPDARAILVPSGANVKRDDLRRTESGIHAGQIVITAEKKTRARQQKNGDRQLCDHEARCIPRRLPETLRDDSASTGARAARVA